jgi:hypothetical protein
MSLKMYKDSEEPIYEVPIELENTVTGQIFNDFDGLPSGEYKVNRGVSVYG